MTNDNKNHAATCPRCGYCQHCGRSNHPVYVPMPYYQQPYWRWQGHQVWCGDVNAGTMTAGSGSGLSGGATSGNISVSGYLK